MIMKPSLLVISTGIQLAKTNYSPIFKKPQTCFYEAHQRSAKHEIWQPTCELLKEVYRYGTNHWDRPHFMVLFYGMVGPIAVDLLQ